MIRLAGPGASASDVAIITLADLQAYMPGTSTSGAIVAVLQSAVDAVNREIYNRTGGRVLKATGTDFDYLLEADDPTFLRLPQFPVVSITAIEYVNFMGGGTFQVIKAYSSTDYLLDTENGFLQAPGYFEWPTAPNSIRARWKSGFQTIPADIKKAALVWASVEAQRAIEKRHDVLSTAHDSNAVQWSSNELPNVVKDILRDYRLIGATCG